MSEQMMDIAIRHPLTCDHAEDGRYMWPARWGETIEAFAVLEAELARLRADNAALLDIAGGLEWYPWPGTSRRMCLLCQYDEKLGHAKSCKYAALGQPAETGEGQS